MKVSQEIVKGLARVARNQGVAEEIEGPDNQTIQAFYLEDVTVSFVLAEKPTLYGLSFEVLGKEFTILPTLDLLVSLPKVEDDDDEIYEIEDSGVIAHIEEYLKWRTVALEKFNI